MNLKIPRLQNITGAVGKSSQADAAHLEAALRENFLAIERWANQQAISCCIAQTTTHSVVGNVPLTPTGPWTVLWDQFLLADTANDRIRIPESGIYLAFAEVFAGNFSISLTNPLPGTEGGFSVAVGGGSSFASPTAFTQQMNAVTSETTSSISASHVGNCVASGPILATTAGYLSVGLNANSTAYDEQVTAFGFVRINNIPSKVQ